MNDDWNLSRVLHPAISAHLALFPVIYNKPIIHLNVIVSSACSITWGREQDRRQLLKMNQLIIL